MRVLPAPRAGPRSHTRHRGAVGLAGRPVMVFFSNRLGCGGSILVSVVGTLVLLLILGVINLD